MPPDCRSAASIDTGGRRARSPPNIVDLTRIDEGKQFYVNRITFKGNTNTHDTVVRRDMRLRTASSTPRR